MGYDIGASVGLTGEAEFKKSLQDIKESFKVLTSEMKLAASQFDKNDRSVEALTAKNQVLGREIDLQKGKVSLLTSQYDKQNGTLASLKGKLDETTKAFGADSEEVRKAQREYDAQASAVGKLEIELNNAKTDLNKLTREFDTNNDSIKKSQNHLKDLGDTINNKVNGAFYRMKDAAIVAGAAIATALGSALVDGVRSTMEAEEKLAQLDAVLESTGGAAGMTRESLIALADGFEQTTKFSAESVMEAESLLLTFTNIGSETFPRATQAAADMATAMGTDMAGQSIALGKALNDPVSGITALTRVGVSFTEEQKKAIKAMQESGDVAGAQAIILAELEKEFGGSAEAAGDTFAGKLEILKNKLGAVTEKLATTLMPYLEQLMDWVAANLPKIEETVTTAFDGITRVVRDVVVPILKFLYNNFDTIKTVILVLVGAMAAWKVAMLAHAAATTIASLATASQAVAAGTATTAQWLWNAAMSANPIGLIIIAITALIAAVILIATHWKEVSAVLLEVWEKIKNSFETAINAIKGFFKGLWTTIKETFGNVASWFGDIFGGAWKAIKNAFSSVGQFFKGIWDTIVGIFKEIGFSIAEGIGGAFKAVINSIIGFAENYINTFIKGVNLAIGLINKIPGVDIPKLKELNIPRMEVGTRYLPADMLIYAHKGEMIVPRSENPYANSGGGRTLPTGGTEEIIALLQAILERTGTGAILYKDKLVGELAPDLDAEFARLDRRR